MPGTPPILWTQNFRPAASFYSPDDLESSSNLMLIKESGALSHRTPSRSPACCLNQQLPIVFPTLLTVRKLSWEDFKGIPDPTMKWSAHIYWAISYTMDEERRRIINVKVDVLGKSWVREERKSQDLLNHEQGHYLIACLCALQFVRRVRARASQVFNFKQFVEATFIRTEKQYLEMQIRYDHETQHRLNHRKQEQWIGMIQEKLHYYQRSLSKGESGRHNRNRLTSTFI